MKGGRTTWSTELSPVSQDLTPPTVARGGAPGAHAHAVLYILYTGFVHKVLYKTVIPDEKWMDFDLSTRAMGPDFGKRCRDVKIYTGAFMDLSWDRGRKRSPLFFISSRWRITSPKTTFCGRLIAWLV